MGGEVTSLDKSVFFWTRQGFEYGYGGKFRDPNSKNLDKGILNANGNFETSDKRQALRTIDIHVGDLLISVSDVFIAYIPLGVKGKSNVDRSGGNKATYLGMGIGKSSGSDVAGVIPDPENYEGGINHIEIAHERTRHRNDALTEEEQAIL